MSPARLRSRMKLAICAMVRDEADRYLPSLLEAWASFADTLVAYDDNSQDNTLQLMMAAPFSDGVEVVHCGKNDPAWGDEWVARNDLFQAALGTNADWLFWLDADMCPARNPRQFLEMFDGDSVAFNLHDLWQLDPPRYREDRYWRAHFHPRIWAVRHPGKNFKPAWTERGIHCGHLPLNLPLTKTAVAPTTILHYGYATEADRQAKREKYLAVADQLSPFERAHAESITDPNPTTLPLVDKVEYNVVRG